MGFILQAGSKPEELDWGSMRWISNPDREDAAHLTTIEVILKLNKGHDFHKHPDQEEVIFVVEGKIEQWLEEKKHILEAGDAIFIPKDVVHASFNIGDIPARLFVTLGPCTPNGDGYELVEVHEAEPWNNLRE